MRLITFLSDEEQTRVGRQEDNRIVRLAGPDGRELTDAADVLGLLAAGLDVHDAGDAVRREDVRLLPPVVKPMKVIGVGMNYHPFVEQLGERPPEHPTLFHKTASALNGPYDDVVVPPITDEAVPEGELALVIGKRCRSVARAQARSHIGGFAVANDVSARNLEFRTSQWTSGKMLDTFCPLGPALVTTDEAGDPDDLEVRTLLDGQEIQRGRTADMIFSVDELVSQISHLVTLEIGDVILTGTPSDLGEIDPPVFLQDGERIAVEVDGLGRIDNRVRGAHLSRRNGAERR